MKRVARIVLCVLLLGCAAEQEAEKLETGDQKISYALGYNLGKNAESQLVTRAVDVDRDLVALGLRDALAGGDARLTDIEMRKLVTEYHRKRQLEQKRAVRERDEIYKAQAEKNKRDGEAFLARNRARSGVETTSSGLQYRVMRPGTGKSPTATGTVVLHYRGRLIDGKEFDSSYERGEPTTFRVNRVIDGWTEALQLMREGAKWEVVVPSPLAYGRSGLKPDVGPNAVLIFETELLEVK
ncbi:MAG: FKBP-type peptidyl-prolyl cis-trans isomerase [Candidatus Latescibacteria bacterium]|nr:FKBP-type peptidyl-prolyl cis-trans isomerase [Candidatus Latescibacterota bacterium]